MLAALLLTTAMHAHCQIEYRDRPVTHPGGIEQFGVGDTCMMNGLTVVADNHASRIVLIGINRKHGHNLTVTIRIPECVKDDTVFHASAYEGTVPGKNLLAILPTFTVT